MLTRWIQTLAIERMYGSLRTILLASTSCKKPSDEDIFTGLKSDGALVGEIKNKNRAREWQNHLTATADTVDAFNWISVVRLTLSANLPRILMLHADPEARPACRQHQGQRAVLAQPGHQRL